MNQKNTANRWKPALQAIASAFLALSAVQNATGAAATAFTADAQERIELGFRAGDLAAIEAARAELLATGESPYLAAYARFRQALATEADAEAARRYLDDCIGELRAVVAREPEYAEARALLGSCYGISTRYYRLGLANRGLEARRQMAAARELAPQNPWVLLQDGLADEATPRLFGGDRKLAIRKLESAALLFEAATADGSRHAAWGAAETWAQLGRMYREAGRVADAAHADEHAHDALPAVAGGRQQFAAAF